MSGESGTFNHKKWRTGKSGWFAGQAWIVSRPMLLFIRFVTAGLCLFAGSCGREIGHVPVSGAQESAVRESWRTFQHALEKPDIDAVASMTRFPLKTNIEGSKGFEGISRRANFDDYFSQMFWDGARHLLMNYQPTPAELQAGEWTVGYNESHGEDMESGVIYHFNRSPDGKVWLTSITFAG